MKIVLTVDNAIEKIKDKMKLAGYDATYAAKNLYVAPCDFIEMLDRLSEEQFFAIAVVNEDSGAQERQHWMIVKPEFFTQDFR